MVTRGSGGAPVTREGGAAQVTREGGAMVARAGAGTVTPGGLRAAREVAASVPDPEMPMMTLADLGILRRVTAEDGRVVVTITPTYSGCPALTEIARDLRYRLGQAGFADVIVRTELTPAWSSDQITPEGRAKLHAAGIAPPGQGTRRGSPGPVPLTLTAAPREPVACPRCGSRDTEQTAAFGPTACTALFRCGTCREPFEYVKDI
jgi:ring-1,2-phenylacetyl-CoA epoxidase subunit PaaD